MHTTLPSTRNKRDAGDLDVGLFGPALDICVGVLVELGQVDVEKGAEEVALAATTRLVPHLWR